MQLLGIGCIAFPSGAAHRHRRGQGEAVRRPLEEDVYPLCQTSILRPHPNVIFLLDEAAASKLQR